MGFMFSLNPPIPIGQTDYICDKVFQLQSIKDLYVKRPYYGLLIINARDTSFWLANELEIKKVRDVKTSIANSHKNGGSSQGRFDRLFENKRDRNHSYIAEQILKTYYDADTNTPTVLGFIIGGTAETRLHVWDMQELSHLSDYIVSNTAIANNDPYKLWNSSSEDRIKYTTKSIKSKTAEIEEIMRISPDKIDFGPNEVSRGLENYLYEKVYVGTSEKVRTQINYDSTKNLFIEIASDYLDQFGGCVGIKYI